MADTRYVLSQVQSGTLTLSLSGSGQVSASSQVDLKSEVSGRALQISVKNGQEVKKGDLLVRLDAKDAYKSVRDAQINLQSAELSLQKLQQATDPNTIFSAENSLDQAKNDLSKLLLSQENDLQNALDAKQSSQEDITKGYEDALSTLSNAFLDFPSSIADLYTILYSNEIGSVEPTVRGRDNVTALFDSTDSDARQMKIGILQNQVEDDYALLKEKYDKNFDAYKSTTRFSDEKTLDAVLKQTIEMTKLFAQTEKDLSNFLDTWVQYRTDANLKTFSQVTSYQATVSSAVSKINTHLSNLNSIANTIEQSKKSVVSNDRTITKMQHDQPLEIISAEQSIKEKEASLIKLKAGTDVFDLRSAQLSVQQRRNALSDAQLTLSNYSIKAPFDASVASVTTKLGESVSSASTLLTLVAKDRIATIAFNEIDVAKIKLGQKVTLSFDAIEGLTVTGEVADIDMLGTVSQGVVNYNVKIAFDTNDDRIKPGMSVSASIILDVRQNILMIPNAAVKNSSVGSYVEMIPNITSENAGGQTGVTSVISPTQHTIEIGLQNDTMTEVSGNIKEGDFVVVRTIVPTTSAAPTTSSILPVGGNRGGAGFGPR